MRIVPFDHDPAFARSYLEDKGLQIGHILPVSDTLLREYFAPGRSFLILKGKAIDAVFWYAAGRDKQIPQARFRVITDSLLGLKQAVGSVEDTAVASEKLVLRTNVFGL